ncbi:Utp14 protein-domain-containing protein [Phyllosticta capitalensis]|uniref:Utp14 protein-domain-containing protein n=1 Tax=Phyllosticta capitalensis TaxID=121624 RepID=A0ABR1YRN3_9PEZI
MPRRIARSSVSASKPKNGRKRAQNQKRNLDAFAIAEREVNDNPKIRKSRMGELEDDGSRRKRQRDDSDDEDEEDERPRHKKQSRDDLDISEGSDSEGNTWHAGHVDDDDDSDIDSDEAFGESDEERFADFTFRGSATSKDKKKKAPKAVDEDGDLDLEEDDEESGEEDDDESLGSDAVDLAQMLDDYEEEEEEAKSKGKKSRHQADESDEDASDDSESAGDDEASEYDMSDEDEDDNDPDKVSELQNFISSISQDADAKSKKDRTINAHESAVPSEFGVASSQKLDIGDLLAGTNDPNAKKMVKMLKDKKSSKRTGIPGKLDTPLPKRQQDKIDRQAANEKAKEQLERWVDTVKHNRRAEHLSFPMKDPDAQEPAGVKHLVPLNNAKPANDLESTIQAIMEESGLATGGKDEEEKIREFEELQTNKLPLEEVLARRAELRKARDLLFREEMRAKRVKKIKSKSFRRVHRKERERLDEQEKARMAAEGIDISEDEKERQDRRRAEARMGAKHRDSKWAKGVKATGRAAWDDDARDGVNEMARKDEELRRRIEGKDVQEDEGMSDSSSEEDDDDSDSGDARRLQRQLNRISGEDSTEAGGLSKLASMKFMQRADAALKAQNDEDVKRIRKELAEADGDGALDEDEDEESHQPTGRRVFGPSSEKQIQPAQKQPRNEFEEEPGSDDEEAGPIHDDAQDRDQSRENRSRQQKNVPEKKGRKAAGAVARTFSEDSENNVLAGAPSKGSKSKSKSRQGVSIDAGTALDASGSKSSKAAKPSKAKATESSAPAESDGWTVVTYNKELSDDEQSDREPENPSALTNDELLRMAFAGDEVEQAFEAEKRAVEEDEGDKVIDNTLPGWGSWAGSGLSKKDQRNGRRFLTTQKGVRKENRKDNKLKNVVINEKRVKKNSKYLASSLPFPHQSKEVYESTLRRPLGPEFNTKEIFQDGTKPRVMVKPGVVIKPLAKPLV